jgi:hypothetical protein
VTDFMLAERPAGSDKNSPRGGIGAVWAKLPRLWTCLGLLLATMLLAVASPAEARKFALVIGNGQYAHLPPDSQLPNAENDATDVAKRLQELGFQVGSGDVVAEINAGSTRLRQAVTAFKRQLSDGDTVVIYYAGHGIQLGDQDYLLPVDADITSGDEVKVWGFPISDLYFSDSKRVQVVIIFDACRDNPFLHKAGAAEVGGNIPQPPLGDMVFFSAGSGQEAQDSDAGAAQSAPTHNSVFASAFLLQLQIPGMTQLQLYRAVRNDVYQRTGKAQLPSAMDNTNQDIVFNGSGPAPPTQTYAAAPPPTEVAAPPPSSPPPTQLADASSAPATTSFRSVPVAPPTSAEPPPAAQAPASSQSEPAAVSSPPASPPVTAPVVQTPPSQPPPAPTVLAMNTAQPPASVPAYVPPPSPPFAAPPPTQAAAVEAPFTIASLGMQRLPPRPDLPVVPAVPLPPSFCSLKAKFDFHDQIYLPAQIKARERYDQANQHLDNLDGLRRQYLQITDGREVFVSNIISEFIQYKKLVTDPAFQQSNDYVAMHDTIMAIPVGGACK